MTRKKMSKSHKGVKRGPMSKDQRAKLSSISKEQGVHPNFREAGKISNIGRKFPKSFSEQISNRQRGANNPVAKSVKSSTGEVFSTIKEAADWCGVTSATIGHCLRGLNPTGGKHPQTKEKLTWTYNTESL